MKKLGIACIVVLMSFSIAYAEWLVDFKDTYVKEGIDKAVENAMKGGANPDMIVENGLNLEGLNPENLVKALFCAGAKGQDVRDAAKKYQISELIISKGYDKSIAECRDQLADSQAYTPVASGRSFSPASGESNGSYASRSVF
jgi:DNA invertase Pin-like site-specific DNA recombinase